MKKSLLAKLLVLFIMATNLSACIILPVGWHGGGRGHYHGEYQDGRGSYAAHNGYDARR